jgi:hypothetical protein
MQARGIPLAKIKDALIKIARSKGYKDVRSTDNLQGFALYLNSKDKVIFDGVKWESVIDLN